MLAIAAPPADDDFMAGARLRLGPAIAAAGGIGRIDSLGDDALQIHLLGGLHEGFAIALEMLDIADGSVAFELGFGQQGGKLLLALAQRQVAKILALGEQKIEGEVDQIASVALGQGRLQGSEIRRALVVQRHHLAINQAIGQAARGLGDGGELFSPVEPGAGQQRGMSIFDAKLDAVAIELDLMHPIVAAGRVIHRAAKLGLDEIGQFAGLGQTSGGCFGLQWLAALQRMRRRRLARLCRRARARFRFPDGVSRRRSFRGQHEGLRTRPFARRDLRQLAARGDGAVLGQNLVGIARPGAIVVMFDQQPVGALAAEAVALHAYQNPAAAEPLSGENEFEIAFLQRFFGRRIAFRSPKAAIPQHHRAAAILALGNRALEIAIVERVILHLDGETLVVGIERGTARHRPGFEHAVEFQAEIVMQAGGGVLLDHIAAMLGLGDARRAAGLGRLLEVALGPVFGELLGCHARSSCLTPSR